MLAEILFYRKTRIYEIPKISDMIHLQINILNVIFSESKSLADRSENDYKKTGFFAGYCIESVKILVHYTICTGDQVFLFMVIKVSFMRMVFIKSC